MISIYLFMNKKFQFICNKLFYLILFGVQFPRKYQKNLLQNFNLAMKRFGLLLEKEWNFTTLFAKVFQFDYLQKK